MPNLFLNIVLRGFVLDLISTTWTTKQIPLYEYLTSGHEVSFSNSGNKTK
jgi:hypothetical protein